MSISENYIPQSENLQHFNTIVRELESITNENSALKNRILTKVDLLIKQLNDGKDDSSEVIAKLDRFIERFDNGGEDPGQKGEEANVEEDQNEVDEETRILQQNERLKEILSFKINYNSQIERLNQEYQQEIDSTMQAVRERKYHGDQTKIEEFRRVQNFIESLQQQEFDQYLKLVQHQELLYKLGDAVSDLLRFFEEEGQHKQGIYMNKLLSLFEMYKWSVLNRGEFGNRLLKEGNK